MVSRVIVSNVSPWLLLAALIILIAGGALIAQTVIRRRFPGLSGDDHNDATRFAFGVVSFAYAFFIGFVVSATWGQINTADAKVRTEGAIGMQLARDLTVFDKPDADRIRAALLDYARAAQAEWPAVAAGDTYPQADAALGRLYRAYEQVQPGSDTQKTFLATSFTSLNAMSQARSERVIQSRTDTGPPWSLWVVLLLTSTLVIGCAIVYGVERAALHYPMVATIGVLVAANLFLVLQLSHPFIGEIGVSPEPLHEIERAAAG